MVGDFVKDRGYLTLGSRFKRLGERLQGEVQELARTEGFDVPAGLFPAIGALDEAGSLTIGELAEALGISQPGATRSVEKLAKLGLVKSVRKPADRRIKAVTLTDACKALVLAAKDDLWPRVERGVAEICDGSTAPCSRSWPPSSARSTTSHCNAGPRSPGATPMHELDRPIWHALATRHREFAQGAGLARRYDPLLSPFAASRDDAPASLAALAALVPQSGMLVMLQAGAAPVPEGCEAALVDRGVQMLLDVLQPRALEHAAIDLGDADAADMLALASLTRPGPFLPRTHRLGRFVGIRVDGRLAAMAGERLQGRQPHRGQRRLHPSGLSRPGHGGTALLARGRADPRARGTAVHPRLRQQSAGDPALRAARLRQTLRHGRSGTAAPGAGLTRRSVTPRSAHCTGRERQKCPMVCYQPGRCPDPTNFADAVCAVPYGGFIVNKRRKSKMLIKLSVYKTVTIATATLLISSCAGRDARPVAISQPQDAAMACPQIQAEIAGNNQLISDLGSEKGAKVAQNVAAGVAGTPDLADLVRHGLQGCGQHRPGGTEAAQHLSGLDGDERALRLADDGGGGSVAQQVPAAPLPALDDAGSGQPRPNAHHDATTGSLCQPAGELPACRGGSAGGRRHQAAGGVHVQPRFGRHQPRAIAGFRRHDQ